VNFGMARALRGQTMTETVMLLPLFFVLVFGLLQLAHLGIAVVMANYAAGSIARKVASDRDLSAATRGQPVGNMTPYVGQANDLMVAGMQLDSGGGLMGCVEQADMSVPTGELVVLVRSQFSPFPFVGYFLNWTFGTRYATSLLSCTDLTNQSGFGPFNYSSSPPTIFVTGTGKVRLNYKA
jgi:hypothetical protein